MIHNNTIALQFKADATTETDTPTSMMTAIPKAMNNDELISLAMDELFKCPTHPKIGAVISKSGVVLSTGFRGEVNGKHAERVAIEKLSPEQLRGSMIHTTLEPCAEVYPGQPEKSCCELIAESGISTVCIGTLDPNGRIYAKGMNFFERRERLSSFFRQRLGRKSRVVLSNTTTFRPRLATGSAEFAA